MKSLLLSLPAAIGLLLHSVNAGADGPGAFRQAPSMNLPSPEERAESLYNDGVKAIESAKREAAAEESATANGDSRAAEKARGRALKSYKRALSRFESAVRVEPKLYEAHTYIGFANRKLGRYDEALKSYATALSLQPNFPPAIEYQGEAFLELNRVEDAKFNYFRLYSTAPEQARLLLAATRKWTESRKLDPQGLDPAAIDTVVTWVVERERLSPADEKSGAPAKSW